MKTWIAILAASIVLFSAGTAYAGPQELIAYTRKLTEAGEIPEMADDAELLLVDDGKSKRLSVEEALRDHAQSKALVKKFEIKEFKVKAAACDEKICHIEYAYRVIARLKNDIEMSADVNCDEDYRPNGTRFILIRGRQVQRAEIAS